MLNVAFFSTRIWSDLKCRTVPLFSTTAQTSFAKVPELVTYIAIPSPNSVFTGMGFLNSSIFAAVFCWEPLLEPSNLAVQAFLRLWMKPTVSQFLLSLSDFDMTLEMGILVFHGVLSFLLVSKCLRMMSVRRGRDSLLPPVSEAEGAACDLGAAASDAPGVLLCVRL